MRALVVGVLVAGCGDAAMVAPDGGGSSASPELRLARWTYDAPQSGDVIFDFELHLLYQDGLLSAVARVDHGQEEIFRRYSYESRRLSVVDQVDSDGEISALETFLYQGGRLAGTTRGAPPVTRRQVTTYGYDGERLVKIRVAKADDRLPDTVITTTISYDASGRLSSTAVETKAPFVPARPGRGCTFTHDGARLASFSCGRPGAAQTLTERGVDARGRLATAGAWTVTYGANGVVESVTTGEGRRHTFVYEKGAVEGVVFPIPDVDDLGLFGLDGRPLPRVEVLTLERVLLR